MTCRQHRILTSLGAVNVCRFLPASTILQFTGHTETLSPLGGEPKSRKFQRITQSNSWSFSGRTRNPLMLVSPCSQSQLPHRVPQAQEITTGIETFWTKSAFASVTLPQSHQEPLRFPPALPAHCEITTYATCPCFDMYFYFPAVFTYQEQVTGKVVWTSA